MTQPNKKKNPQRTKTMAIRIMAILMAALMLSGFIIMVVESLRM